MTWLELIALGFGFAAWCRSVVVSRELIRLREAHDQLRWDWAVDSAAQVTAAEIVHGLTTARIEALEATRDITASLASRN